MGTFGTDLFAKYQNGSLWSVTRNTTRLKHNLKIPKKISLEYKIQNAGFKISKRVGASYGPSYNWAVH